MQNPYGENEEYQRQMASMFNQGGQSSAAVERNAMEGDSGMNNIQRMQAMQAQQAHLAAMGRQADIPPQQAQQAPPPPQQPPPQQSPMQLSPEQQAQMQQMQQAPQQVFPGHPQARQDPALQHPAPPYGQIPYGQVPPQAMVPQHAAQFHPHAVDPGQYAWSEAMRRSHDFAQRPQRNIYKGLGEQKSEPLVDKLAVFFESTFGQHWKPIVLGIGAVVLMYVFKPQIEEFVAKRRNPKRSRRKSR
jgi:hypothetical protein